MKITKYGSSGTRSGLISLIAEFWYRDTKGIELLDNGSIALSGVEKSIQWWKKGKRYYFGAK